MISIKGIIIFVDPGFKFEGVLLLLRQIKIEFHHLWSLLIFDSHNKRRHIHFRPFAVNVQKAAVWQVEIVH